ncbi:MAG: hypothetical protein ACRCX2_04355 [Paraclostridium sp.]
MDNVRKEIVKQTDEYNVSIYHIEDLPMLSYAHIDTDELCLSRDLVTIYFDNRLNKKKGDSLTDYGQLKELDKDIVEEIMLEMLDMVKDKFEDAKEVDCPHDAFYIIDKRDLTCQFYKCVVNQSFSPQALYYFGIECYQRIEDNYGYEIIFPILKQFREDLKVIGEKLSRVLALEMDKDGFITVYRGFNNRSRVNGTSYTLDRNIAKFFANRWKSQEEGYIKTYKVHIDDVVAFIDTGEKEILTDNAIEIKGE